MRHFLTIGTLLGLSAGFAPGPLLTLVISETLQHGIKSGIKVALAPIVTDLPIIVLTLFILSKLSAFHNILGIISLAGGLFIFSMGYKSLRIRGVEIDFKGVNPKSLTKGVLANALSPHPYLFWFSVGAPTVTKAMAQNISAAVAFIVSFYAFLVGSKICLAIFTGKSKSLLSGKMYIFIMRLLGLALCILAIILIRDGLELLQIIKA
jgi:threonine/homoserine/homoserine lactone efflux protein